MSELVTEPVSEPVSEPAADELTVTRSFPRSALFASLGIAAGAALVLFSSSPTWIRVVLRVSRAQVRLTGGNVAAAAVPLALVAAAGLIAMALVRNWIRRILAVLIAAAGVGVLVAVIRVIDDPLRVARDSSKVKSAGQLASAHLSAAPYLCVVGALLIIAGAVLAAIFGGRWPNPARRYEREAAKAGRPVDAWEALERGEDPTSG